MSNFVITSAPGTGWPWRVSVSEKAFGTAARFGVTCTRTLYGDLETVAVTGPGPTRAATFCTLASALEGGARLESTAAAKSAATTKTISPVTRRRSRRGAEASLACRRGFVRARLTDASRSAALSKPIFQSSATPYEVLHRLARVGNSSSDCPIPVPISSTTEQKATTERRGTT